MSPLSIAFLLAVVLMLLPEMAFAAHQPLQCNSTAPVGGTSLFDDSTTGACRFTGIQYIFSTIICQFVSMVNMIMGKLYCTIQSVVSPVVLLLLVVFVMTYGIQMVMGTAQLNSAEMITRCLKMAIVYWLVTDPEFGVSAAVGWMFSFFIGFISDTTRWVVSVLQQGSGLNFNMGYNYNPGITATFYYIDQFIYNALTGALSEANAKVMGFFVALGFAMPSILMLVLYWWLSVVKMLVTTLITFLTAVVAVAFLLGLSPIFISFMLFKITFQFFDQWLRFMISFSMQVMISFAILTMWLFSLTLFAPFFNEISEIIFPYNKVIRPATAIYNPVKTWGLCPIVVTANPIPSVRCRNPGFNPSGPVACTNATIPAGHSGCLDSSGNQIPLPDNTTPGMTAGSDDYTKLIPPSKVPELSDFLFYIFYHLLTLIIVSYGFASLQKNSKDIARQLAGPSYTPPLNASGIGSRSFGTIASQAQGDSRSFMSKELFGSFNRKHNAQASPFEGMLEGAGKLAGKR